MASYRREIVVKAQRISDGILLSLGGNTHTIESYALMDVFVMSYVGGGEILHAFNNGEQISILASRSDVNYWELL